MESQSIDRQLASTLIGQEFSNSIDEEPILSQWKKNIRGLISIEKCLAVLSNLQQNSSDIFSGDFGSIFGLPTAEFSINSAFEDDIFHKIHPDDLAERHVLELRFFMFQMQQPINMRRCYNTWCRVRVLQENGSIIYITHRTFYLANCCNGKIWLSLCLYSPSPDQSPSNDGIQGYILNYSTGEIIPVDNYTQYDKSILSKREIDVLQQLALGANSQSIANKLYISIYTVYRHRQNILQKLQANNTPQAIRSAALLGLIKI